MNSAGFSVRAVNQTRYFQECTVVVSAFSSKPKTHGVREVSGDQEKSHNVEKNGCFFQFLEITSDSMQHVPHFLTLVFGCRAEKLPGGSHSHVIWKNWSEFIMDNGIFVPGPCVVDHVESRKGKVQHPSVLMTLMLSN